MPARYYPFCQTQRRNGSALSSPDEKLTQVHWSRRDLNSKRGEERLKITIESHDGSGEPVRSSVVVHNPFDWLMAGRDLQSKEEKIDGNSSPLACKKSGPAGPLFLTHIGRVMGTGDSSISRAGR